MSLKNEWKDTGKELGGAFKSFGKSFVRSAEEGSDKLDQYVDEKNGAEPTPAKEGESVFNDGTWRNTGKELGGAFKSLGKTLVKTVKAGAEAVEEEIKD